MSKYSEALKELKHWKETNNENGVVWIPLFAVEDIEKTLIKAKEQEKALKIIYEKTVDIELLQKETTTLKDYNEWIEFLYFTTPNNSEKERQLLTEEEFDLLKEVLENAPDIRNNFIK